MLLSTAPLLQPLHNRTHQWDCVVPLVVSFVLRIKGTEPCMSGPVCAPVTPPTHTEFLLLVMGDASPSWHCTVFTTVPLLLMLISAYWATYLFPCCLSLPTEHKPPSACILLGLFLAVSPASGAALTQQNRVQ